jgi:PRTRC genetic system protein A
VARGGVPRRRGLAYDYVLAGDGLFLAAETNLLSVRVPVARCAVRGLEPVYPACTLAHGRLPARLWHEMARLARGMATIGREVLFAVVHDPATAAAAGAADSSAAYRLDVPDQIGSAARVAYRPPGPGVRVALELHSHHAMAARFSRTDDADEQRLCLYGVIGRLDWARPEVALRVGAYGHYLPLPWESVFDGTADERAGVHDAHFDGPYRTTAGDPADANGAADRARADDTDELAGDDCASAEGGLHDEPEMPNDHTRESDHLHSSRFAWRSRPGPAPRRLSLWHELRR